MSQSVLGLLAVAILCGFDAQAWGQQRTRTSGVVPNPRVAVETLIEQAHAAITEGTFSDAETFAKEVLAQKGTKSKQEEAEAKRILGLARFFQGDTPGARRWFLAYLLLMPDAHLDPAIIPPEAIVVFEDVRAQNAALLEVRRPKTPTKRYQLLNLVPSGGQFQNGETGKAWVLLGSMGIMAGLNIATYFTLKTRCDGTDHTCSGGIDSGKNLKTVNLVSGVALIGLYVYSVVDGYLGYRAQSKERRKVHLAIEPTKGSIGTTVGLNVSL